MTFSNFLAAAERIVGSVQSNDVVLLSISTHGGNTEDANGTRIAGWMNALELSHGDCLWPSNVVAFAERLKAKGAKLVQVYDACYAEGFVEMTGCPGVSAVTCEELSQGLTDGGFFTSAFLEVWRHPPAGADLNGDGILSLYELAVATQRTYIGNPDDFWGAECCICKPEELAKVAVRKLPKAGEKEPVRVITDRMPPAYVNQSYVFRLRASGESNLTWFAQSEMPAGLTLDADGLVRGYPAWSSVTNFSVRVDAGDGRWAETNIVLGGLLAASNSRPRIVSVTVPQGAVTRRRDEGDWTVRVVAESVQNPTNVVGYYFSAVVRGDDTTITNVFNTTGEFTLAAELLASWPDVYVVCLPYGSDTELVISEKSIVWFIRTEEPPTVQLGVVAQRYPWNGWLDIQYRTLRADASYKVVFYANGIELGSAPVTDGEAATASFNLNAIETFKNKAIKNVKITAKLVSIE